MMMGPKMVLESLDDAASRLGFGDSRFLPVSEPELLDLSAYARAQSRALGQDALGGAIHLFRNYKPHARQVQLHKARRKRFVAVCAGRRAGKTIGLGHEFVARIFTDLAVKSRRAWVEPAYLGKRHLGPDVEPVLKYWCVAPTYRLGMLQQATIFAVLGGIGSPLIIDWNISLGRLWLEGGVLIEFRSADKSKLLVGDSLDGLWVDEAARLKADAWADNLFANLSDREGWALLSTTPLGYNWFHAEVWQRTQLGSDPAMRDGDFYGVHFTTADNTAVPALVREAAKARARLPGPIYRRNYEASFDAFDGQIFESFDVGLHVVADIPFNAAVCRIAGVDFGLGNAGTNIELIRDDRGTWYAYREDYARGLPITPPTTAPQADSWMRRYKAAQRRGVERFWADPAGAVHILTAQNEGLDMRGADNSVGNGIMVLQALLHPHMDGLGRKQVGLKIHRGCTNLIREMQSYRWDRSGEKPVKEDDHAIDGLRYGVVSEIIRGGAPRPTVLDFSIFDEAA